MRARVNRKTFSNTVRPHAQQVIAKNFSTSDELFRRTFLRQMRECQGMRKPGYERLIQQSLTAASAGSAGRCERLYMGRRKACGVGGTVLLPTERRAHALLSPIRMRVVPLKHSLVSARMLVAE